jgi:hypothetical protein
MLWLSNWETYPSNQIIFFETVRRGCKEDRHIIDAPGHLFESSAYDINDYESRTPDDEQENAVMSGLLLLMICFTWDGYLITPNQDCIILDDNCLTFCSWDDSKIEEAYELAAIFKLTFREQRT